MSASLVRKSLEVVDPDLRTKGSKKKNKKGVFTLLPEQHRIISKTYKKGGKAEKVGVSIEKKYTVEDAKKQFKSKEQILQENLKKLEIIKQNSTVVLDKESTKNIIERAVTRRPIKSKRQKSKGSKKTAFTEEDFKKFEEEYMNS